MSLTKISNTNKKTALVTGASRGIGEAISVALAKQGYHVIISARTIGGLERTDDLIEQVGGTSTIVPLDLKKPDDIDTLGPNLFTRFPKLDLFVGNAGILGGLRPLTHYNPKTWEDVFNVNVHANYRLIRTLEPLLKKGTNAKAIFIGSGMASQPQPFFAPYAASKAALEAMIKTYQAEKPGFDVDIFYPGVVETKMLEEAFPGGYPDRSTLVSTEDAAVLFMDKLAA